MTHKVQFPRGKNVRTDVVGFLVSQIINDAARGTSSTGLLTWGELTYRVKIQKIKTREKAWQFWRPKR